MGFWRAVDWQRPWLEPYRALGEAAVARLAAGDSVAAALNGLAPPLRFVAHDALPPGEAYEAFVQRSASVPTRDNLHDLFNGLVWLRFPALKRRLNQLQAAQIAAHGVAAERGALRDALTLFDENAALWRAPPALVDALRRRDWRELFVVQRPLWADAAPVLFGHALMEKLVHPRKAITAHLWVHGDEPQDVVPGTLRARPFLPLPVLGVPGWWPPNESPGFYDDASVFRVPLG